MLDIPRSLWQSFIAEASQSDSVVDDERFVVGHFFLSREHASRLFSQLRDLLVERGFEIILAREDVGQASALGPMASKENPVFVQLALLAPTVETSLYDVSASLESMTGIHVVSLSRTSVVYKVVGDAQTLCGYYADLADERCLSTFCLAHTRYSTNTATSFSRVQPFALTGHNGEINTISRFHAEAKMIGLKVDENSSDSQMVDAVVHSLTEDKHWSLFEAVEMLFPPIVNEIKQMKKELSDMYMFLRALWGPFSQGPAGIMMRKDKEAIFAIDALGLRPMWLVETEGAYCFSSEQGIIPQALWTADPKALSPGEKIGVKWTDDGVRLYSYTALQTEVYRRLSKRYEFDGEGRNVLFENASRATEEAAHTFHDDTPFAVRAVAFGWRDDDVKALDFQMQTSAEPIKSLGYDGPLAPLDDGIRSLSDFVQETVAVVTNPAIDREREMEHFSTRVILGRRPSFESEYAADRLEIQSPFLLEAGFSPDSASYDDARNIALRHGTLCYEDALAVLHDGPYKTAEILIHREQGEDTRSALARFRRRALEAVNAGANAIVLDDRLQFRRGAYLDPFLAVAAVHNSLCRSASHHGGEHLRRRTSLILRSGGLRNLHDVVFAVGMGADAVDPYLMWEVASSKGSQAFENLYVSLCKGLEKVISTLGIHELRGYGKLFGAIGLHPEIATLLGVPNFCASESAGYGMAQLDNEAVLRQALYDAKDERKLRQQKSFALYPRIWRAAGLVASGETPYRTFFERLDEFEAKNPINLRHLLRFRGIDSAFPEEQDSAKGTAEVDTSIDGHNYPFVISSMSFGSQGEVAYRSYAEAAYRMNIVGLNGEGGEIKDLLNKYPRNRGRQIASGRFGVNAELANGAYVLEIKIGQGAKPGEGGHLPGSKVTQQVANARHASVGVDLISPSNNHDIYSIEDLAQVIYELRQVNPTARIAVKVPVVPNIGTIAVGIAKAGADVVSLSGFDGGTGAARSHAIRHVGLPVDIGIARVHDALCESGLRDSVEIWADGGMKSGADVMKAILLGANRVGFGTMAMVSIGCTSCRACHKDTCHVGIATQMTDAEEAAEKGVTTFSPREFETSVEQLTRLFTAIGEHVRVLTAALGATRTQDLVGRRDLLTQYAMFESVDLSSLVAVEERFAGLGSHVEYRTWAEERGAEMSVSEASVLPVAVGQSGLGSTTSLLAIDGGQSRMVGESEMRDLVRALGTRESGEAVRNGQTGDARLVEAAGVGGNGFAAFHRDGMVSVARGGAGDGVGKSASGGKIVVLKERAQNGEWYGGSVGKGLGYGAQEGLFIVQGGADARAGIRLSGADMIIGGQLDGPLHDDLGWIGERSTIKGFAFEYMTAGRALVLGDPGPWICSGMTGGTVYLRRDDSVGLTESALRRRIAKGAKVTLLPLDGKGKADVAELLSLYQKELRRSGQADMADELETLRLKPAEHFLMIRPSSAITDQSIATE